MPVGKSETVVGRDVDFTREEEVRGLGGWEDAVVGGVDGEEEVGNREEGRASKRRRMGGESGMSGHGEQKGEEYDETEDPAPEITSHSLSTQSQTQSQAQRYAILQSRLTSSINHRNNLRQKVLALKRLKSKLEPFEDAQTQVQPNLMWKGNKEVEAEVARMRVLLVKCREVGRRGRGGDEMQGGMGDTKVQTQTQRIESVLGLG